jgi:hypothetical protein
LFHLQSKSNTQTFLGLGEAALGVLALALSPNGMMIALGCGRFSLLYRVHSGELFGPQKLWHSKSPKASVCSQKLNFSVDSTRVVSCIQVGRSSQKHDLYVAIWVCDDEEFELERQLDPIELSVVSLMASYEVIFLTNDERGLWTIKASAQHFL